MSEWIKCSEQMPPNDGREIFIRRLVSDESIGAPKGEWHMNPSNEIWFDVSDDKLHEWEWAPYSEKTWKELNHV